jgi:hypothetical protein
MDDFERVSGIIDAYTEETRKQTKDHMVSHAKIEIMIIFISVLSVFAITISLFALYACSAK